MILERLLHKIGSCRAAADDANMLCLAVQQTMILERLLHKIILRAAAESKKKKTINNMRRGRMTFLTSSTTTDRVTRFLCSSRHLTCDTMQRFGLSCHALSGNNMLYGVHRPACFVET